MAPRSFSLIIAALTLVGLTPAMAQDGLPADEPGVHARLNLDTLDVWIINTTDETHDDLALSTEVFSLQGTSLLQQNDAVRVRAKDVQLLGGSRIRELMKQQGSVLVALRLYDGRRLVSSRTYWHGLDGNSNLDVVDVPRTTIHANTWQWQVGNDNHLLVTLENRSKTPALGIRLRLVDRKGVVVQPARYSENGLSLLPGETRRVVIHYPANLGNRNKLDVDGWNVRSGTVRVVQVAGDPANYPVYTDTMRIYTPAPRAQSAEVTLPRK